MDETSNRSRSKQSCQSSLFNRTGCVELVLVVLVEHVAHLLPHLLLPFEHSLLSHHKWRHLTVRNRANEIFKQIHSHFSSSKQINQFSKLNSQIITGQIKAKKDWRAIQMQIVCIQAYLRLEATREEVVGHWDDIVVRIVIEHRRIALVSQRALIDGHWRAAISWVERRHNLAWHVRQRRRESNAIQPQSKQLKN